MEKSRKVAAIVLSLALAASCAAALPAVAADESEEAVYAVSTSSEESEEQTYGDYEYTVLDDGTIEITDYTGSDTELTIPSEIDGKAVTSIGEMAFAWCDSLTSVTIPLSVTSIGYDAFAWCDSLTSIDVDEGNTVYSSEDGVLFNKDKTTLICCPGGKSGEYTIPLSVTSIGDRAFGNCDSLTSVTIPSSVTSIGYSAFYGCDSLTSITIPSSVTSIGDYVFEGSALSSITIPESVTSIGYGAFWSCGSLTSITIPSSVTSIKVSAFNGCYSLTSIDVDKNNTVYSSEDGVLFNKDKTTLICCPEGKSGEYTIPSSVTSIGNSAFANCESLTSVTIPSSVTSIEDFAFYECYSLTSVTIPNSVTSIGNYAFYSCGSLTIYGYEGTAAETYANDNGITFVALGDEPSEESSNEPSEEPSEETNDFTYSELDDGTIVIDRYTGTDAVVDIPSEIDGKAVTAISYVAFYDCSNVTTVNIGDNIKEIGYGGESGNGTVFACPGYVFFGCTSLTDINVSESNSNYSSVDGVLFNKDQTTLLNYPAGKTATEYDVLESVTLLDNYAFSDCVSLETVYMPDDTLIGTYAVFANCTSLKNLNIPSVQTNIPMYAFQGCTSIKTVTLTGDITSICDGAFDGCTSLESVVLSEGTTSIGNDAFNNCTSLKSATIPASVDFIGLRAFGYYNVIDESGKINSVKDDDFVIYGYTGTKAETYANENEITFVDIDDNSNDEPNTNTPNTTDTDNTDNNNNNNNNGTTASANDTASTGKDGKAVSTGDNGIAAAMAAVFAGAALTAIILRKKHEA